MTESKRYVRMRARYNGHCEECLTQIEENDEIIFDAEERQAYCLVCGEDLATDSEDD